MAAEPHAVLRRDRLVLVPANKIGPHKDSAKMPRQRGYAQIALADAKEAINDSFNRFLERLRVRRYGK
jgi:hypothetical protein